MTDDQRAYIRKYIKGWKKRRRAAAIAQLGGKCAQCGATRRLEFDHIDRRTKSIKSSHLITCKEAKFTRELKKCQLLCHHCHTLKSAEEERTDPNRPSILNPRKDRK